MMICINDDIGKILIWREKDDLGIFKRRRI